MVALTIDAGVPAGVRAQYEPVLRGLLPLLPGWLQWLEVFFAGSPGKDDTPRYADVTVLRDRHRAGLTLYGDALTLDGPAAIQLIAHEYLHVTHWRYHELVEATIKRFAPEEARDYALEVLRHEAEVAIDDAAFGVLALETPPRVVDLGIPGRALRITKEEVFRHGQTDE